MITTDRDGTFYRHCILVAYAYADDEERVNLITLLADRGGFTVLEASTVQEAEARAAAQRSEIAAIIVDNAFPDGQGTSLIMQVRRQGIRVPIIRLVDVNDAADPPGYDWLLEPHLVKPVSFVTLLETLITNLHQFESGDSVVFPVGPYSFRTSSRTLHEQSSGEIVRQSEKESALLKSLLRARGQAMLRTLLLEEIWGLGRGANTHTVETDVYRLRKKLERNAQDFQFIETTPGGYRLKVTKRAS